MSSSDQIALASGVVSAIALIVAVYAIFKGNRNSSVATLISLSESCRSAWNRFLAATTDDDRTYELAELMNTLEIAAAILNEDSLAGVSKTLLRAYLEQVLTLLRNNAFASAQIEQMLSVPDTFECIQKFYRAPQDALPSITRPKRWFQR
ncbi:MAG TPA: hypothetical protein VFB43_07790 [Terracidiphilus sp.]|nr:hypothetical protein [Terracidiphilus sp.]